MSPRECALIVSPDATAAGRWAGWLESAGYSTVRCPGPLARNHCPRVEGDVCVLREAVDVAFVDVDPFNESELLGNWPERECTKVPDDARTIFIHDHAGWNIPLFGRWHLGRPTTQAALVEMVRVALQRGAHPAGMIRHEV